MAMELASWAVPLPTACSTGTETLGWPVPVALAATLALEVLGLTTAHTALTLWRYEAGRRKADPEAPSATQEKIVEMLGGPNARSGITWPSWKRWPAGGGGGVEPTQGNLEDFPAVAANQRPGRFFRLAPSRLLGARHGQEPHQSAAQAGAQVIVPIHQPLLRRR